MRLRAPALLLLPLLAACSDYDINPKDDVFEPVDSEPLEESPPIDDSDEPPAEDCDGLDNDSDGSVDEGFGDVDLDGLADCLDSECSVELPEPVSRNLEECGEVIDTSTPPKNPWSWVIQWSWRGGAVYSTPIVADIDADGKPEVLVTAATSTSDLMVFNGEDGTLQWKAPGVDNQSGLAAADVDGDGYAEVFATTGSCYSAHTARAYDYTGALLWETTIGTACETYPTVADIEGDGVAEVVVNEYVLDAQTGAVKFKLPYTSDNWGAPVVVDLDLDGKKEILLDNDVFDSTGGLLFTCGPGGTANFPHPVNIDSDPEGEVLFANFGALVLCDTDGTELRRATWSSYGMAVAVADFDNDGEQEFGVAKNSSYILYERDLTRRWTTPITDGSGLAGSTSWDINLDGVPEVVYADEADILVIDGSSGAVVLREGSHTSATLAETPSVADVNGDGTGELIYGSNGTLNGLTVIGSKDGDWPYSPPYYNEYGYYYGNINADLSVPTNPDPPWLTDANLFRGQPSAKYVQSGLTNLTGDITDVCAASCETGGVVNVVALVINDGGADAPVGTFVGLYGSLGGVKIPLATEVLTSSLSAGSSLALNFAVAAEDLKGLDALVVVFDSDEAITECVETDNEGEWVDLPCQ